MQTAGLADAKGECLLFARERNSAPTQFVVENLVTDLQNVLCDRLGLDVGTRLVTRSWPVTRLRQVHGSPVLWCFTGRIEDTETRMARRRNALRASTSELYKQERHAPGSYTQLTLPTILRWPHQFKHVLVRTQHNTYNIIALYSVTKSQHILITNTS